jgi:hypothetical protein
MVRQELYRSRTGRYSPSAEEAGLQAPEGVALRMSASEKGFAAVATDGKQECAVYKGSTNSPRPYARKPDIIVCRAL